MIEIVSIVIITSFVVQSVKLTPVDNKFLPVIAGICGLALSILMYISHVEIGADNVFDAIAIGISSGLASVGANQTYKQLVKK